MTASLADRFRQRIRREGPIPLAEFMAASNAHRYGTGDPIGRAGDFVTAPEISQMFGELVGLWCVDAWRRLGMPRDPILLELGPGRGTLMTDLLRAARVDPGFAPAVHLVETSPALRQVQRARGIPAVWHETLDTVPDGPTVTVANEFFDALPVHQFQRVCGAWCERRVDWDGGGFRYCMHPSAFPGPSGGGGDGDIVEVSPAAAAWAGALAARPGYALIVDYGYWDRSGMATVQAVRGHRRADPLADPGAADVTAHVDFRALADAARAAGAAVWGPVPQGRWLRRLGIEARAAGLGGQVEAVERLAGPDGMGELFRVMAFGPAVPAGFGEERSDDA